MVRRTFEQIEKDEKMIRDYVASHSITSIKEIALGVNLSESQILTSIKKHPQSYAKIQHILEENRRSVKAKKESKINTLKTQKTKLEVSKIVQPNVEEPIVLQISSQASFYVIDASITGLPNFFDVINQVLSSGAKIVLTSITLHELDNMQMFTDIQGLDARKLLDMAANSEDDFLCIRIDDTIGTPDDCIIKYCADNSNNLILITSDKYMALKARSFGVKTQFLKQSSSNRNTLYVAKKVCGKLIITTSETQYRSILVMSNGIEYKDGIYELNIGDDVYLATKKDLYLTFAHYKILSLGAENNCRLVFSRRFYTTDEINNLKVASYKSFMKDFSRNADF